MLPIHAACIENRRYLFLRKVDMHYQWFSFNAGMNYETATDLKAAALGRVISSAYQYWKEAHFRLLHCGFRYMLPTRDETGSNALFYQMALSYNSPNGQYFDEELGHLCYVDFASQEALEIWRKIR